METTTTVLKRSRMFEWKLESVDGEDFGLYDADKPSWRPGDRFPRGPGDTLEVVEVRDHTLIVRYA